MKIKYEKIRNVKDPVFSKGNAGIDFFLPEILNGELFLDNGIHHSECTIEDFKSGTENTPLVLIPGASVKLNSGIKLDIPEGYAIKLTNKSGIASKGLTLGACLIDSSYTGELIFNFICHRRFEIEPGMKIVQGVIIKDFVPELELVEEKITKETDRGDGGFGSTGV